MEPSDKKYIATSSEFSMHTRLCAITALLTLALPAFGAKLVGKTALPGLADMHVHLLGATNGVGLDMTPDIPLTIERS